MSIWKNSLVGWCVWSCLQNSLMLPLDPSCCGLLIEKSGVCRYIWMEGNSSVGLSPSQFLWSELERSPEPWYCWSQISLLCLKLFFRIGLGHHLGLDGSFVLMEYGWEIRFQRLAVICIYANAYTITLLFKCCLLSQATESGSRAEHNIFKTGKPECVFWEYFIKAIMRNVSQTSSGYLIHLCAVGQRLLLLNMRLEYRFAKARRSHMSIYTAKGKPFLN